MAFLVFNVRVVLWQIGAENIFLQCIDFNHRMFPFRAIIAGDQEVADLKVA